MNAELMHRIASQETGDVLLLGNYALASALNGILAMQVLSSASNRAALKARENTMELHSVTQDTMADASRPAAVAPKVSGIQMAPAATMRSPTPSARSNRTPSRQWVRKAD